MSTMRNAAAARRLASRELERLFRRSPKFNPLPEPEILGKATTVSCQPALFEPDQMERAVSGGFGSTVKEEFKLFTATTFTETPPHRYHLKDVFVLGGQIFPRRGRIFFNDIRPWKVFRKPLLDLDTVFCPSSGHGCKYFGHWLRDDCALYELVSKHGKIVIPSGSDWIDSLTYADRFSQDWTQTPAFYARSLYMYKELGFNLDKAKRLQTLRSKLRQRSVARGTGKVVYIMRGSGRAPRHITNQDLFQKRLEAHGVVVLRPEIDSDALISDCLDADLAIGVEGSHLSHAVYGLKADGALLSLQPPERIYAAPHEWARLLGMRHGIVIGSKDGDGFRIDPDEVLRMIDRLMSDQN